MQIFKSLLELLKLSIQKVSEILVMRGLFNKFIYYSTFFSQAQCSYIKHEQVLFSQKVLSEKEDPELVDYAVNYCMGIVGAEGGESDDIHFYLENLTLNYICDINQIAFKTNHAKQFKMLKLVRD